jgi:hypothetical protein
MSVKKVTTCDWCGEQVACRVVKAMFTGPVPQGFGSHDLVSELHFHEDHCWPEFIELVAGAIAEDNATTGRPVDAPIHERSATTYLAERHERRETQLAWQQTDAFRDARASFGDVGLSTKAPFSLADAGIDLERAAQMTDAELLAVPGMGPTTLGKLRRFLAEREQYEEEAEAA